MPYLTNPYLDLRYIRVPAQNLPAVSHFMGEVFGLQPVDGDETLRLFRSDWRSYSICFDSTAENACVAVMVGTDAHLGEVEARLASLGFPSRALGAEECARRQIKRGVVVAAPNGVDVEIVVRHVTSGWRFYGKRDAGVTGLEAVAMSAVDVDANRRFWVEGLGGRVADWAGDAVFIAFDERHHRLAIYPSDRDGLLGVTWAVESKDSIMVNWYHLQKHQVPIVAGPDRQPTSGAIFVTGRSPTGLLVSYAAETEHGPHLAERGPRQFADEPSSHRAWGSHTDQREFQGSSER